MQITRRSCISRSLLGLRSFFPPAGSLFWHAGLVYSARFLAGANLFLIGNLFFFFFFRYIYSLERNIFLGGNIFANDVMFSEMTLVNDKSLMSANVYVCGSRKYKNEYTYENKCNFSTNSLQEVYSLREVLFVAENLFRYKSVEGIFFFWGGKVMVTGGEEGGVCWMADCCTNVCFTDCNRGIQFFWPFCMCNKINR